MNVVKITKLNDDGSIAFEGFFPPDEARLLLEVGMNLLFSQGLLMGMPGEEEEEEDETDQFLDAMNDIDKSKLQ